MSDSTTLPDVAVSKANPVLIMAGVIAGLEVLLGGSALADFIDDKWIGLLQLVLAAITVAWGVITRGQVTPWRDVVAKITNRSTVVAGPAATQRTGSPVVVTGDAGMGPEVV